MTINISVPEHLTKPDMKPKITVIGVGGAGGNAVDNMIQDQLAGVEFVVANTDSQALSRTHTDRRIQLGVNITGGLGAGSRPEVGQAAAEESLEELIREMGDPNMVFITAGMGGGTGTGAAPVIARAAREQGILTVGVVTKPFDFEGVHRMRVAEAGLEELEQFVDTLIIIPNQNLFRVANEKTTFADAFKMADDVLHSGVRGITDLIVMPGLINLDFADIRAVMSEMGKAMMGTGEAGDERRALDAAEAAIANPLLDDNSLNGATGVLINITGGPDMTLFEVDEAVNRIRSEVEAEAHIIFGSTFADEMDGRMRISIVATGMDASAVLKSRPAMLSIVSARQKAHVGAAPEEASTSATVVEMPESAPAAGDGPGALPPSEPLEAEAAEKEEPAAEEPAAVEAVAAIAVGGGDAYIPPPPVDPRATKSRPEPDPFAVAAMANGPQGTESQPVDSARKSRGLTLFERVTGTGRAAKPAATNPAPVNPAADEAPAASASRPESDREPAKSGQPRLGGLDPNERLASSNSEDDLLDIPAFLRRQAN
ncbi:MAG: cell division protein FtsZ [Rhodospirillales bacterium]|jgi:cell division protein FtsZ|nr:cell division protein FtsZ [Rhodospirillales bacterium]MDP6803891.1 cell division protein FtsZ [Rhodospirillales bacterium]